MGTAKKRKGNPFDPYLFVGEWLLWAGQPDPWVLFTPFGPMSVLLSFVPVVVILLAWILLLRVSPLFFALTSIWLAGWFVFPLGMSLYKTWRKRYLHYGITNRRILILNTMWGVDLQVININSRPVLMKRIGRGGAGTIKFGTQRNRGFWSRGYVEIPGFYDIRDAKEVYKLLSELCSK
jgi:hypothetical protein